MEELKKTININFRLNGCKWILSQPFAYPLLLICGIVGMIAFVFDKIAVGAVLVALTILVIFIFGSEYNGVFWSKIIWSWFKYQFSKKTLLKKEIYQRSEAIYNNTVVTKDYAYKEADVNSKEFVDSVDKEAFNNQLTRLICSGSNGDFSYSIRTELVPLRKEQIDNYLEGIKKDLPTKYAGAYKALSFDLTKAFEDKSFNQISTGFRIAKGTNSKESLRKQIKNLENELQLFQRVSGENFQLQTKEYNNSKSL